MGDGTILVLSGGEPLFRPDILEIAETCKEAGTPYAGTGHQWNFLVDEAMARRIVDAGIERVSISYGADARTHDDFREKPAGSL